jgi:cob(I)alamin adenosyltransferase
MVSQEIANMDANMRGVKRKVHQTESEMVRKGKKNEDRRMIEEMVKNVEQLMGLLKENVNDKSEFISFY